MDQANIHVTGASVARCDLCRERCARLSYWDRMQLCHRCYVGARALAALVGRGSR